MVNNPGTVNVAATYNFAGMDDIVANERTRATAAAVTLTGAASLGTAIVTNNTGTNWINGFGTPRTCNTSNNMTILAADLLTGIITVTPNSTITLTLDTAQNLVNGVNQISAGAVIGDVIQCLLVNGGTATSMTLAHGTNNVFDTNQANTTIASGQSKLLYIRLTNVTGGSEAATIYF